MSSQHSTPTGKVPLDYVMWLREVRNVELANATGIRESAISQYRRGLKPKPEHREKIADFLNLTEAELGWTVGEASVSG